MCPDKQNRSKKIFSLFYVDSAHIDWKESLTTQIIVQHITEQRSQYQMSLMANKNSSMSKTGSRTTTRKTTKRSTTKFKEISVKLEFGDQCLMLKKVFWWPNTQHNQLAYEQIRDVYLFENDAARLCIEIMPKTDGDRRVLMFRTKTAADCELLVGQLQQRKMFAEIYRGGNVYPVQYNQWKSVVPHNDNEPDNRNTEEGVQKTGKKVRLGSVEHFELETSDQEFVFKCLGSFPLKKKENLDTQQIKRLLVDRSDKTLRQSVILSIKTDSMTRDQGCWWSDSDDRCLRYTQIRDIFHSENDQKNENWVAVDAYLAKSGQRRLHIFGTDNYKEQRLLTAILKKRQILNKDEILTDDSDSDSRQRFKNRVVEEVRKEDDTTSEEDPRECSTPLSHKHQNQGIPRSVYRELSQEEVQMNANSESSCEPEEHREIQDVKMPMKMNKNPQCDLPVDKAVVHNPSLNQSSQVNYTTTVSCPVKQFYLEHIDAFNVDPDENLNATKVEDYLSRRQASHSPNKVILECVKDGLRLKDNVWWPKSPEITVILCKNIKGIYPLSTAEPKTQFALDIISDDDKHRRVHIFKSPANIDGNKIIQKLTKHKQSNSSENLLSTEAPAPVTHELPRFSPKDIIFDVHKDHHDTPVLPQVTLGSSTQHSPDEQPFRTSPVIHNTNVEANHTSSWCNRRLQPKHDNHETSISHSDTHSTTRHDSKQILSQPKWKAPSPADLIIQYDSETDENDTPVYILITNLSNQISPAIINVSRKLPSNVTSDSEFQNFSNESPIWKSDSTSAFARQNNTNIAKKCKHLTSPDTVCNRCCVVKSGNARYEHSLRSEHSLTHTEFDRKDISPDELLAEIQQGDPWSIRHNLLVEYAARTSIFSSPKAYGPNSRAIRNYRPQISLNSPGRWNRINTCGKSYQAAPNFIRRGDAVLTSFRRENSSRTIQTEKKSNMF